MRGKWKDVVIWLIGEREKNSSYGGIKEKNAMKKERLGITEPFRKSIY